ncbi:hypothetical protein [Streptomyces sp. NBC_01212]|uniref:hypothetical protein n=1 Tax=Streptomyces sp. NBC_01212 TaxID=2903775 RepID=UPI002E0EF817|nr:hypothetical protein OG722_04910 [Streptomyces sp. NBC_01212]
MQFREGQTVAPAPGKYLPFESARVSHVGRQTVGVVTADGSKYLVHPKWIVAV